MRWTRPYFDRDAYAAGRHCGSTACSVQGCGGLAVVEKCETGQSEPTDLDMWFPLCSQHDRFPVPNWREVTEAVLRPMCGEVFDPQRGPWVKEAQP